MSYNIIENQQIKPVAGGLTKTQKDKLDLCIQYNPDDDWLYIGGQKWKKANLGLLYLLDNINIYAPFSLAPAMAASISATTNGYVFKTSFVSGSHFAYGHYCALTDVTDYSTMKVKVRSVSIPQTAYPIECFALVTDTANDQITSQDSHIISKTKITADGTYSVDISNATGNLYVGLAYTGGNANATCTVTIEQIWLEKN